MPKGALGRALRQNPPVSQPAPMHHIVKDVHTLGSSLRDLKLDPQKDSVVHEILAMFVSSSYLYRIDGKYLTRFDRHYPQIMLVPWHRTTGSPRIPGVAVQLGVAQAIPYDSDHIVACAAPTLCVEGRKLYRQVHDGISWEKPVRQHGLFDYLPEQFVALRDLWPYTLVHHSQFLSDMPIHPSIFRFAEMCDPDLHNTRVCRKECTADFPNLRCTDLPYSEFESTDRYVECPVKRTEVSPCRARPLDSELPSGSVAVLFDVCRPVVPCSDPPDVGKIDVDSAFPCVVHPVLDYFFCNPNGISLQLGNYVPFRVGTTRVLSEFLDQRHYTFVYSEALVVECPTGSMFSPSVKTRDYILTHKKQFLNLVRYGLMWSYYVNFHVSGRLYINGPASIWNALVALNNNVANVVPCLVGVPLAGVNRYTFPSYVYLDESTYSPSE